MSHHQSQVKSCLSVECCKSSSWKLIGQFCRDVIGCKSEVAFVSCDWSVSNPLLDSYKLSSHRFVFFLGTVPGLHRGRLKICLSVDCVKEDDN